MIYNIPELLTNEAFSLTAEVAIWFGGQIGIYIS